MTLDNERPPVVEAAGDVTDDLLEAMARLIPQLSSSAGLPDAGELRAIVESPDAALFVARSGGGAIVGMLTLVTYRIPTGVNAVIEDVVVDDSARGIGIGAALVSSALAEATRRGVRHVDLTSRASREAANRLYERMGFERRETNVYRYRSDR